MENWKEQNFDEAKDSASVDALSALTCFISDVMPQTLKTNKW